MADPSLEDELLNSVVATSEALSRHREQEQLLLLRRDEAILAAVDAGLSQRLVAAHAGVERGLIGAIRKKRRGQ